MLNAVPRQRPWYYPLLVWWERLLMRRRVARTPQAADLTERVFPIPADQAHRYARAADEVFYQERIVAGYKRLPPVRVREYRW